MYFTVYKYTTLTEVIKIKKINKIIIKLKKQKVQESKCDPNIPSDFAVKVIYIVI